MKEDTKEGLKHVLGILMYSFIVALIPGAIWVFLGLLVDLSGSFMSLSWWIKIPIYIVVGLSLHFWRPLYPSNKEK